MLQIPPDWGTFAVLMVSFVVFWAVFKRLLFVIPSLVGVVIVTFLLTRALPGDPAAYFAGPAATKLGCRLPAIRLRWR